MEWQAGFSENAIIKLYNTQGLDLSNDLKEMPDNNHENSEYFRSNHTLVDLLLGCRPPPMELHYICIVTQETFLHWEYLCSVSDHIKTVSPAETQEHAVLNDA